MTGATGRSYFEPGRGGYDLDRVALGMDGILPVDLKPATVKVFIETNWAALIDAITPNPH
ncbi:hypothetical protein AB0H83_40230 [Dactylosporangium sp. NPDC050688]|uniref:hypothetical protein n=1 Tax=Dactylosporangium sp. NPDC050688 TaxID=3157217 RepID=UPI0033CBAF53